MAPRSPLGICISLKYFKFWMLVWVLLVGNPHFENYQDGEMQLDPEAAQQSAEVIVLCSLPGSAAQVQRRWEVRFLQDGGQTLLCLAPCLGCIIYSKKVIVTISHQLSLTTPPPKPHTAILLSNCTAGWLRAQALSLAGLSPAVCPWTGFLMSLCFSFFIWKMRWLLFLHRVVGSIKKNASKSLCMGAGIQKAANTDNP